MKHHNKSNKFSDIALKGGGIKGIASVASINTLEQNGFIFRNIIGTSVGALICAMLATKIKAKEIQSALKKKNKKGKNIFNEFMQVPDRNFFEDTNIKECLLLEIFRSIDIPIVPSWAEEKIDELLISKMMDSDYFRQIILYTEKGGFFSNQKMEQWLITTIDSLNQSGISGIEKETMKSVYEKTKINSSFVICNVSKKKVIVANKTNTPNAPFIKMAIASAAIPQFFEETIWDESWGGYITKTGKEISIAGDILVDGGTKRNFPIQDIMNKKSGANAIVKDSDFKIGIYLDDTIPLVEENGKKLKVMQEKVILDVVKNSNVTKRISALAETMLSQQETMLLRKYKDNIISIPVGGVGSLEFEIEDHKIEIMEKKAREQTMRFIEKITI